MNRVMQKGFTIIEVLVVVTVLGIIASIAILGVQGAQVQARNAQTATVVSKYKAALEKYVRDNGKYPDIPNATCLGKGYKDYDGNGTGDCWHLAWPTEENDILNNALKPYMNNEVPTASNTILKASDFDHVGAAVFYEDYLKLDGVEHRWMIAYTIQDAKCPVGPLLSMPSWPSFSTTPPSSGYTEDLGNGVHGCWIALPDPTKL
jgi:prepilin-type N-terminal cleavage/methylation domain-containing protein